MIHRIQRTSPALPATCPCGIHPTDCTYHREAYTEAVCEAFRGVPVSSYWGIEMAEAFEAIREEIQSLVREIQASHETMNAAPTVPAPATEGDKS